MRKEHWWIVGVLAAVIIIMLIVARNKKLKSKAIADRNKANNDSDYHKSDSADPARLLPNDQVTGFVVKLGNAYNTWHAFGGINNHIGTLREVAHLVTNQAQWSQILESYAMSYDSDLYTDVLNAMSSSKPGAYVLGLSENEEQQEAAIKGIKDYIKTLPE